MSRGFQGVPGGSRGVGSGVFRGVQWLFREGSVGFRGVQVVSWGFRGVHGGFRGVKAAGVSHDSPRAQTCTFEGPGASETPPKFHEKTPRQRQKNRKWGREVEKKSEILGPPPFGETAFGAPAFLHPTLRGPTTTHTTQKRIGQNGIGQSWSGRVDEIGDVTLPRGTTGRPTKRPRWAGQAPYSQRNRQCCTAPSG